MRHDGRSADDLRPVTMEPGWHRGAEGSVLYRAGGTVVLCTASVEDGVKEFLRGQGKGWVTAEYLMHPRAGGRRQGRDGFNGRPLSGRAQEIARLIGRALRASVDARALGERTITIDCDVLEADGGTRTASITGGMVALALALHRLRARMPDDWRPLTSLVSAISVGVVGETALTDLAYVEDRDARMDCNVVATAEGAVVEIQATSEGEPVPSETVSALVARAMVALRQLTEIQRGALRVAGVEVEGLCRRDASCSAS